MLCDFDRQMLLRAERLAMNGRGVVEPNPMVGCVLVRDHHVIGEGWHVAYGQAHAEPTALADCAARGNTPDGATAYVTLEPCCHTNKKTPPCAPQLIAARVRRVVIGCLDPNPDVNGKGVAMLRAAGIDVDVLAPSPGTPGEGWGEGRARGRDKAGPHPDPLPGYGERGPIDASRFQQLLEPFYAQQTGTRSIHLLLKWAETADGFVAGPGGARLAITSDASNRLVHRLRARCGAIVVGVNTVIADDPLLTVRGIEGAAQPVRVVLDSRLRIPTSSKLVQSHLRGEGGKLVVLCEMGFGLSAHPNGGAKSDRYLELTRLGIATDEYTDLLHAPWWQDPICPMIMTRSRTWLVEPGPTLARSMLPWADRLWVFRSQRALGASDALRAAPIPDHWVITGTLDVAGDTLTEYINAKSEHFHAAVPSADFVLAAEGSR